MEDVQHKNKKNTFLKYSKISFQLVTRKIAQSAKFSAIVALLVLMVIGIENVFADNTAQIELDNFGELLDGVAADILATQIHLDQTSDENLTLRAELLVAQISYLKAFEEVIQNNIF